MPLSRRPSKAAVGLDQVDNTSDATKNSASATLTNKTINLSNNTFSGTTAQFNTALSDGDFVTLAGSEVLTNKTLTSPVINTSVSGSAVATAATASTLALRDAQGNLSADAYITGFTTTPTSAGTTTLDVNSTGVQEFTGTTTHTVRLPTTSVVAGAQYTIVNHSTGTVTVQSSGTNTISALTAGRTATFTAMVAVPTTAAHWDSDFVTISGGDASTNTATSVDNELVLFSGTTGKLLKRASTSGIATLTSGVLSTTATTGSGNVVLATSPTLVTPNLGTPSALTLTNATGLPVAGITASTSTALGVGSIELGHATDTTLARGAAGRLTVEGINVPTISSTDTLTNKTISGSSNTITNISMSSIGIGDYENIVSGSDFESSIYPWNLGTGRSIASDFAHSGTYSYKFTAGAGGASYTGGTVEVKEGERLYCECWVRRDTDYNATDARIRLGAMPGNLNVANLFFRPSDVPTIDTWVKLSFITNPYPAGNTAVSIAITMTGLTLGNLWIDDIVIRRVKGTELIPDLDAGKITSGMLPVTYGGTGRATSTTAYGLIAAGTTATGALQTLATGASTDILVSGGSGALPVWTTATGSGAPVRATSPTLVTPNLGTPSALTLTNATGLPVAGITASTSTALGVGSIELGHATDTTLARGAAGRLTVEGINVPTISSTDTLTNKTISGANNTLTNIPIENLTSTTNIMSGYNPNFASNITGWTVASGTWAYDGTVGRTANGSAKFTAGSGQGEIASPTIPVTAGTTYMLEVWVSGSGITNTVGDVDLWVEDYTGATLNGQWLLDGWTSGWPSYNNVPSSFGWRRLYGQYDVNTGIDGIRMVFNVDSTVSAGNIYFDDARIVALGLNQEMIAGIGNEIDDIWDGAGTIAEKTFNNTNTVTLLDTNFTLQDDADTTKTVKFNLSSIGTGTAVTLNVPNVTGSNTLLTLNSSATVQNKRMVPRVTTVASSATPTFSTDTCDMLDITALATNITSMTSSMTGTPNNGQKLLIRFKDNGTPRTIAWGTGFQSSGATTLLSTTIASKEHNTLFIYSTSVAKWICVATDSTGY